MRVIEENMVNAVKGKKNFKSGNTVVEYHEVLNSSSVFLHGNHIAEFQHLGERLIVNKVTLARWDTVTTKNRLRALGAKVYTAKGVTYLNGEPV